MQPSELGIRVEQRRKELGISQRRLAVLAGVSQGAINQLALGVTQDAARRHCLNWRKCWK